MWHGCMLAAVGIGLVDAAQYINCTKGLMVCDNARAGLIQVVHTEEPYECLGSNNFKSCTAQM